jgi:hypothetical protein
VTLARLPSEQSTPTPERFVKLAAGLEALAGAIVNVTRGGWAVVLELSRDADASSRVLLFDLADKRRADPPLHARVARFMGDLQRILAGVLRSGDVPADVRQRLEHLCSNAAGRMKDVQEMDRDKIEVDQALGLFPNDKKARVGH